MIKTKFTFVCDMCPATVDYETQNFMPLRSNIFNALPQGWKHGNTNSGYPILCPPCSVERQIPQSVCPTCGNHGALDISKRSVK